MRSSRAFHSSNNFLMTFFFLLLSSVAAFETNAAGLTSRIEDVGGAAKI